MRSLIAFTSAVLIGIVALFYASWSETICDGGYDLEIRVKNSSLSPITHVHYQLCKDVSKARATLTLYVDPRRNSLDGPKIPLRGDVLTVGVPVTDRVRQPWFGPAYVRTTFQFRGMLIFADYADGTQARKAIEIPERTVSRRVEIEFP